jgi:hypothetical protein
MYVCIFTVTDNVCAADRSSPLATKRSSSSLGVQVLLTLNSCSEEDGQFFLSLSSSSCVYEVALKALVVFLPAYIGVLFSFETQSGGFFSQICMQYCRFEKSSII